MSTELTETLIVTLPIELWDIARKIGRALDPDVGGEFAFTHVVMGWDYSKDDIGVPILSDTISTRFPCTPEFRENALIMLADANILHMAVVNDYATRWPGYTPPTLDECAAFNASAVVV